MAQVRTRSCGHYTSCRYNAIGRLCPNTLYGIRVERVDIRSLQGDDGPTDSSFTEVHTVRFVHLLVATGYTTYEQQFGVVIEAQVVHITQELVGLTYAVRVFGITTVEGEGMTVLRSRDIVRPHRHEDGELTVCIGSYRHTADHTRHSVHTQRSAFHGVVGTFVVDSTRYANGSLVGEVDIVVGIGVVIEIERTIRRRKLMRTKRRHDLVVRTRLAIRDAGDDVGTVRLGISRVVCTR